MTWTPTFSPTQGERALEVIRAIADDLRARFAVSSQVSPPEAWSVAEGRCGVALFFAYLGRALGDADASAFAARLVEEALDAAAGQAVLENLFTGLAGVAWTLAHVDGWLFDLSDGDPGDAVDAALLDRVRLAPWRGEYDLVSGLVGIGVYALERLPRPGARELLANVVARLSEIAGQDPSHVFWWTPAERLAPQVRRRYSGGAWDLGVAHGVPGVIGLLALASAAGLATARPLTERAVDWLLARQLPAEVSSGFPSFVAPGVAGANSRLAWCYGEPGIAGVLLLTERRRAAETVAIAERAAARPAASSGVVDASLCHGSAGLAHLFNRLHQVTDSPVLFAAAERWLEHALNGWRQTAPPGLLTGQAGIGLALLAACTPLEPRWDRLFLLS